MPNAVRGCVINVADVGRSDGQLAARTSLRRPGASGHPVQFVVAVAYDLPGRTELVGRGRTFLPEIAVRVVLIVDLSGFRVPRLQKLSQRVIGKPPLAPRRRHARILAWLVGGGVQGFLMDAQQIAQRVV